MRFPALPVLFLASVTTVLAQTPQTKQAVGGRAGAASAPVAAQPEQKSADANGVDTIISLVKANMSEALVLKTIQRQNKSYDLTPEDLVKLQKAGVSEKIINAMLDPSTVSATPAPSAASSSSTVAPPAATPIAPAAPTAASGPAESAPASKGASTSKASASGCPQQPSTAAPAQQQTKGGVFSSFKDKLKGSAQKTVDGFGDTLGCAVDKGMQASQSEVGSAVDNAAGAPAQKVADIDSAANKAPTNNTSTTGSATAAQAQTKKSAQK
jgi:uncharacterized membrane protein